MKRGRPRPTGRMRRPGIRQSAVGLTIDVTLNSPPHCNAVKSPSAPRPPGRPRSGQDCQTKTTHGSAQDGHAPQGAVDVAVRPQGRRVARCYRPADGVHLRRPRLGLRVYRRRCRRPPVDCPPSRRQTLHVAAHDQHLYRAPDAGGPSTPYCRRAAASSSAGSIVATGRRWNRVRWVTVTEPG